MSLSEQERGERNVISLNGAELLADSSGALLWPELRLLVVADLHLEKGSAHARGGRFLPPYDTAATLSRLEAAIRRCGAERVVCLGDSFHDQKASARMAAADLEQLRRLTGACDWTWICGNHDPHPPGDLGGTVREELRLGPLLLRHQALSGRPETGEVSGHFHPKAAVRLRGKRVTGRCFAHDRHRLLLPAFGAYAGGLNVLSGEIRRLFREDFLVHLLGRDRLFRFPGPALVA